MVLCWVSCFSLPSNAQELSTGSLDPTQVYNTGNVVVPTTTSSGSTWVNGVYQDNLTCWAWGNPGYCGPNAIVRPDGNINFSFGQTDLYQSHAIANILPNSGTGLRVNGYNFSFTAKNGNGWDNGRLDYLSAYVHFTDKSGKVVEYDSYNLTSQFNWTNFNFSKNFTSPYAASTLGNVTYGLIGQDWNGWAGPYGPEVNNVSFSLKYSVDPCVSDPLWSPTCTGYFEALSRIVPATSPATTTPTSTAEPTSLEPLPVQLVSNTSNNQAQTTTTAEPVQATSSQPSSTVQQTAVVNEPRNESQKKSGPNLSQIMSIVGSELNRINQLESKTVSETTAQAAAAAQSATSQAEAVANNLTNQSIASSIEQGQAQAQIQATQSQSSSQGSQNLSQSQQRSQSIQSSMQNQTPQVGNNELTAALPPPLPLVQNNENQNDSQAQISVIQQIVPVFENQIQTQVETNEQPLNPLYSLVAGRVINLPMIEAIDTDANKNGPAILSHIPRAEQSAERPVINENQNSQPTGPSVRRGGKVEGMDGGADMNQLAAAPADFNSYLNSQMRDAQFYTSREIYRGQRNVDNARVLRGLGTDRLHQEMINQQYNQGAQ